MSDIAFEVKLNQPYEQAIERATSALKSEGFGVLTRIDVHATLKEKLGVDFRPYAILGACNPPLAHRALSEEPRVGLLLPCNVTVEELEEGSSLVRIANPEMLMAVGDLRDNPTLIQTAQQARSRLERVLAHLSSG